jgi:hypothetical protein
MLQSRVLVSPSNFDLAVSRCKAFGMRSLRVYGLLDNPVGVVFATGGGGTLELSRTKSTPPSGVRLWIQVPSLVDAIEELQSSRYPGAIGPAELQPWGLLECEVELFDGVSVIVVEVPRDHPLHWRG